MDYVNCSQLITFVRKLHSLTKSGAFCFEINFILRLRVPVLEHYIF